jgi:DnaJ-class molecular chaperone
VSVPGYGDPQTWPVYAGHPNDPRDPGGETCIECAGTGYDDEDEDCGWCHGTGEVTW